MKTTKSKYKDRMVEDDQLANMKLGTIVFSKGKNSIGVKFFEDKVTIKQKGNSITLDATEVGMINLECNHFKNKKKLAESLEEEKEVLK